MDIGNCVSGTVVSLLGSVGMGSEPSGNNSPISSPALFLVYFLGASCSFPTSSAMYLFAFISNYSLLCWQKEHEDRRQNCCSVATSYFPIERPRFLRGVVTQVLWSRWIVFRDFWSVSGSIL